MLYGASRRRKIGGGARDAWARCRYFVGLEHSQCGRGRIIPFFFLAHALWARAGPPIGATAVPLRAVNTFSSSTTDTRSTNRFFAVAFDLFQAA